MRLERDPKRIAELARKKEDANWAFRYFLKSCDLSVKELDSIVHKHYKTMSGQIDCRKCANCCRVVRPLLKRKDVERLATHLRISRDHFLREYLVKDAEKGGHLFKSLPCSFLSNNLCTVYSHRPDDCRSYPHIQKKEFVFRLNQAFSNCSVCPIVYNVYERLKRDISDSRDNAYLSEQE
jgi:hypothetical protein